MEANQLETIYMIKHSGASGIPMRMHEQHVVSKKLAKQRYQRGLARPAAEVYFERLKALGLKSVTIDEGSEASVARAAKKVGLKVYK